MNPIMTALSPSSLPGLEPGHPRSLAERALAQARADDRAAADQREPERGELTPLPGPEPKPEPMTMEQAVRDWALQMFKEKLMFGDEEETGVTPLSIDI